MIDHDRSWNLSSIFTPEFGAPSSSRLPSTHRPGSRLVVILACGWSLIVLTHTFVVAWRPGLWISIRSLEIICNLRGPTKLHYELSEHFGTQRCSPKRSQGYQAIPLRKHCLGPSRIAAIDPLGPWSFSGVISGGEGFGTVDA